MCAYFPVDKAINDSFLFQTKIKERIWQLRDFHFNNVFSAMLTLYTSATGEGWPRLVEGEGESVFLHGISACPFESFGFFQNFRNQNH